MTFEVATEGGLNEVSVPALLAPPPAVSYPPGQGSPSTAAGPSGARPHGVWCLIGGSLLTAVSLALVAVGIENDFTPALAASAAVTGATGIASVTAGFVLILRPLSPKQATVLPLQVGPLVARNAGGLTLGGAF